MQVLSRTTGYRLIGRGCAVTINHVLPDRPVGTEGAPDSALRASRPKMPDVAATLEIADAKICDNKLPDRREPAVNDRKSVEEHGYGRLWQCDIHAKQVVASLISDQERTSECEAPDELACAADFGPVVGLEWLNRMVEHCCAIVYWF